MTKMSEADIDLRWPVLAQVVRAIEWHGGPDADWFCKSFGWTSEYAADRADAAEAELANLTGYQIVQNINLDPGETDERAPNACAFLTAYFE